MTMPFSSSESDRFGTIRVGGNHRQSAAHRRDFAPAIENGDRHLQVVMRRVFSNYL
jgi:hypothetical protein